MLKDAVYHVAALGNIEPEQHAVSITDRLRFQGRSIGPPLMVNTDDASRCADPADPSLIGRAGGEEDVRLGELAEHGSGAEADLPAELAARLVSILRLDWKSFGGMVPEKVADRAGLDVVAGHERTLPNQFFMKAGRGSAAPLG